MFLREQNTTESYFAHGSVAGGADAAHNERTDFILTQSLPTMPAGLVAVSRKKRPNFILAKIKWLAAGFGARRPSHRPCKRYSIFIKYLLINLMASGLSATAEAAATSPTPLAYKAGQIKLRVFLRRAAQGRYIL